MISTSQSWQFWPARPARVRGCRIVALGCLLIPLLGWTHPGALNAAGCHVDAQTHKLHCHSAVAQRQNSLPKAADEGVYQGVVIWVADGDTLHVRVRDKPMEVRLAQVDAPERDQPYGWRSKLALIDLVRDKEVRVAPMDVDRYGRIVAHVYIGDLDIAHELVRQGAAWFYSQYATSAELYQLEQQARSVQRGLWSLPAEQRMEPWEWRRRKRKE